MLKKMVFMTLLTVSTLSFADNHSTLMVKPNNPNNWGYQAATVDVGNSKMVNVGKGVALSVALHNPIHLVVYAMNARPRLDVSCQNLTVTTEGSHQLSFELKPNWLVYCQYV